MKHAEHMGRARACRIGGKISMGPQLGCYCIISRPAKTVPERYGVTYGLACAQCLDAARFGASSLPARLATALVARDAPRDVFCTYTT